MFGLACLCRVARPTPVGLVTAFVPVAVASALLLDSATAHAELTAEMERRAQEIIRTTMSPFCPGRTLDSCPSPNAADWRQDVRNWVEQGVSTQEIRKRLVGRTPDGDLTGAPSTALDAVMPILVSVIAVLLVSLLLRRLLGKRGAKAAETARPSPGADLDRRLDEELARLDE